MQVPLTPLRFLDRSAKYYPERTALICGSCQVSYREFNERVNQASNMFSSLENIEAGNDVTDRYPPRIGFITWNCHRVIEASFAALRASVIRVPLNARLTPTDWAYMLNDVGAEAVVVDEDFAEQFVTIRPKLKTVKHFFLLQNDHDLKNKKAELPDGFVNYESTLSKQSANWDDPEGSYRPENEPVEIFFTSGTTGKPKGVILTPRNLYLNAVNTFLPLQLQRDDIFLHSLALFHVNGWGALHFMTACGGTQIVMKRFKPEDFCSYVQKHRVTLTCLVPTMMNMLVHFPQLEEFDLSSLRLIMSGGAKLPIALGKEATAKLGCEILGSYGLTETSPVVSFATELDLKDERREAGGESYYKQKFCPGIESLDCMIRVVGDDGTDVEWDGKQVGEILVRGNVVADGYWAGPEETEAAFTTGEVPWLRTGDLAVVDPEGYTHIVDRKRDIIIRGGENISSLELEDVLRSHTSVAEAAVIPAPSDKWGEVPLAVVVTRPGEMADEQLLLEFCKSNLASFKVPEAVKFVDVLPKSGTGKILKRELRKKLL